MQSIRTAIIGAGFMGPTHTEALRRLGIEVAGILGVDEAESTKAAQKLGLPRAYLSYTEVLKDKNVHAVHITTPNRLHFQMARDALKAGKHVLCEKPLAMNTRETAGSNCVPAWRMISSAAASPDIPLRYGRSCVIASNASTTAMMREI